MNREQALVDFNISVLEPRKMKSRIRNIDFSFYWYIEIYHVVTRNPPQNQNLFKRTSLGGCWLSILYSLNLESKFFVIANEERYCNLFYLTECMKKWQLKIPLDITFFKDFLVLHFVCRIMNPFKTDSK